MEKLLQLKFEPQPDITAYELSLCIPYILSNVLVKEGEINVALPHFRHFQVIETN